MKRQKSTTLKAKVTYEPNNKTMSEEMTIKTVRTYNDEMEIQSL